MVEYNNVLRGMVVENLTQRDNEFREELDNLILIRKYLRINCSPDEHFGKGGRGKEEPGSYRDIADWLNKAGEVVSIGKISQTLSIADNLDEERSFNRNTRSIEHSLQ